MLLVANPRAAALSRRLISKVAKELGRSWSVTLHTTGAPREAEAIAASVAAAGCEIVVALGGDGTVNEVVNGICGSDAVFACLPGGGANVFHRMTGVSPHLDIATRTLAGLKIDRSLLRQLDVGVLNGRNFVASAGVGVDASVARWASARRRPKATLRHWHYLAGGIGTFCSTYIREPPRMEVKFGDTALRGVSAAVQNGPHYTYFGGRPITLGVDGRFDDGALTGALLRRARAADVPSILASALRAPRCVARHPQIDAFRLGGELVVVSENGLPIPTSVDGEYVGSAIETTVSIRPRALTALLFP